MCENITLDSQILSIYAFETTSINAKITLHKEIAEIIKNQPEINAMLAVFYDESKEFRLSLVTQGFDYEKNKTTFSNLRRQSFTLGENTKTKTAKLQLQGFLDKEKTLKNLQEAFSTEPISKEFYGKYERLYKDLSQKLCQNQATFNVLDNYEGLNGEKAVNAFVKKLLGRIVFLYFLQKKGWLGVAHNDSYGTGDKNFLFSIFSKATQNNESFYTKYLCPLFFETLNTERKNDYSPHFDCKIPFLNGGLFEECKDKQGKGIETNFILTQSLENTDFKEIFNVFENYNFTIEESTPDNQEIGIDPEMLGKVFENLIDYNKSSGAFYTPREIVHFMCKNVLTRTLQERILHDESHLTQDTESPHAHKDSLYNFIFYKQSNDFIAQNATTITHTITSLNILDPAIGSGAFPMGMLSEILEALHTLNPSLSRQDIARLKREIIEQQIYGIDIDADAIEIAKLRFWLSIAVDEDTPSPLPNLDFKFMQGNALIESINGIEIMPSDLNAPQHQKDLWGKTSNANASLFDKSQTNKLEALFLQYYEPNAQKAQLKAEILSIMKEAFDERIKQIDENIQSIKANPKSKPKERAKQQEEILLYESFKHDLDTLLKDYKEHNFHTDKLFLYRFFFAPVFQNGGFDIVIGNPPYISAENMPQIIKDNRHLFDTTHKKTDIYVYFYELALKILKNKGIVSYITSNKFLSQEYGLKLRELLLRNHIHSIVNFYINIFESASVDTCICLVSKQHTQDNVIKVQNIQSFEDYWRFEKRVFEKIKQDIFYSLEHYNFRLTLNESKISLLESIQRKSHRLSDICLVSYGVRPCGNSKYPNLKKKDFIHKIPIGNAKPYIEAKSEYIAPYTIHHHDYLDYQQDKMYNAMFEALFTPPKLMAGCTLADVKHINFVYDDKGRFCNHSMCAIVLWQDLESATHPSPKKHINKDKITLSKQYSLKFLQGILNSNLIRFYVKELLHDGLHFYPEHQKQLPIPQITDSNRHIADRIIALVDEILNLKIKDSHCNTSHLEAQIDTLVYKLYNLNNEEIKIINGGVR
ncbi:Eco57I restriction-modification methylase domain-containing protein [Helicobacter japonicus]|uniref:Eco57I restriction-modification methylase domain-containing protein n=1 Tax=Helicobacter japonicus TaxID=425400 RepID=UPI0023F48E7A|nr:N-6 DNA methylase [Helicobacter japonicus]